MKENSQPLKIGDVLIAKGSADGCYSVLKKGSEYTIFRIIRGLAYLRGDDGLPIVISLFENSFYYWRRHFTRKESKEEVSEDELWNEAIAIIRASSLNNPITRILKGHFKISRNKN